MGDALRGQVTHRITIRYQSGLTVLPSWRVTWADGGKTFTILAVVEPLGITRWLELLCMEGE